MFTGVWAFDPWPHCSTEFQVIYNLVVACGWSTCSKESRLQFQKLAVGWNQVATMVIIGAQELVPLYVAMTIAYSP